MSETLDLAADLIRRPSVTPDDAGCQALLAERLSASGFAVEHMPFNDVSNLWARRGTARPLLVFAGHTDVVPPGPREAWHGDPFEPVLRDGLLYGRGAADMKGSLAAMIDACRRFVERRPDHRGSIGFLITSDEEGPAVDGTVRVMQTLKGREETIDWCLVGEPTSSEQVGDVIKNGRRGSLSGTLVVEGVQGHVAYPQLADNPVHRAAPALAELCARRWDEGSDHFPPTTFQISNLRAGTGAGNVIPGTLEVQFNFRYSTAVTHEQLRTWVREILDRHGLRYRLEWSHSGRPFLTEDGRLMAVVKAAIRQVTGRDCRTSTSGGTSDGRFIAPGGAQVIELGPVNATIHKADECVQAADLEALSRIYETILDDLLGGRLTGFDPAGAGGDNDR